MQNIERQAIREQLVELILTTAKVIRQEVTEILKNDPNAFYHERAFINYVLSGSHALNTSAKQITIVPIRKSPTVYVDSIAAYASYILKQVDANADEHPLTVMELLDYYQENCEFFNGMSIN